MKNILTVISIIAVPSAKAYVHPSTRTFLLHPKCHRSSQHRGPNTCLYAFQASNYLDSLSASDSDAADDSNDDTHTLLRALRDRQAQICSSQQVAQKQAMQDAMRRTFEFRQKAIANRLDEMQKEYKKEECEKLERLYRNEKMYPEKRERQMKIKEERSMERNECEEFSVLNPHVRKELWSEDVKKLEALFSMSAPTRSSTVPDFDASFQ